MKLGNMRIGKRLVGGYAVLICIILSLCILSFKNTGDINTATDEIVNSNFQKTVLANSALASLQGISKEMQKALYTRDKSLLKIVAEKRASYKAAIEKLEELETDAEGKEIGNRFNTAVSGGREVNMKLQRMIEEGHWEDAVPFYHHHVEPSIDKIVAAATQLVKFQEEGVHNKYGRIVHHNRQMRVILLVSAAVSFAFAAIVSLAVTRSITTPIEKNIRLAETLADGNLSVEIVADRNDEFGDEMKAYRMMVEKWKKLITQVKTASESVASASHELSASAEQVSKGASVQVVRTRQVSTASAEMSQVSLDVAKNANSISASAKEMVRTADSGSAIVDKSVAEVNEIALTVRKSSDFVRELGDQSEKIGEIILVINDIADQTNLLALNAAIEAARAGDAGRGFAVVADEVKKLAERTGRSTQEIAATITSIKSGLDNAVKSMDEASARVKAGVGLSNQTGTALREIVSSSSSLQSMVQQIAAAIEEMNSTTNGIAKDIEQVALVAEDSSNAADQMTRAALELSALSVGLADSVLEFKV